MDAHAFICLELLVIDGDTVKKSQIQSCSIFLRTHAYVDCFKFSYLVVLLLKVLN